MKPARVLLALSLAANAALVAVLVFVPAGKPPSNADARTVASAPPPATAVLTPAAGAAESAPDPAKPWARLGTEDLGSLISRLRAAGYPESVLRAIVYQRFELRREELTHDDLDTSYWKKAEDRPLDPTAAAALVQIDRGRDEALKQFFDSDDASDESSVLRSRQFGDLPAEKISRIQAIQRSYGERANQLYAASRGGVIDGSQMEKIAQLNSQQHDEIAKLLTPDELLEFDLRSGQTSDRLRQALTGLNPTEAEYRALFSLYQAYDSSFPPFSGPTSPQDVAARAGAQQQMQEQIKALLPPDRYADYLQASNPQYQQLNQLVTRLDLPLSAAAQVVAVQQDTQERASAMRRDNQLSDADRTAQLAALADEAAAKIAGAIGARGLEGYRQYGGQWLAQLQPRPARANSRSP